MYKNFFYKKNNSFSKKFLLLKITAILIPVLILISLGTWQIYRYKYKTELIATIKNNLRDKPIIFPKKNTNYNIKPFSVIKISGHFINNKTILVYGKRSGTTENHGYYWMTPFHSSNGQIFLVSRGWVPHSLKNTTYNIKYNKNEEITAIALSGEKKPILIPENDVDKNIWFTIDLKQAQKVLSTNVTDIYLMQIENTKLPKGIIPLNGNKVIIGLRNNHLEYAITWYSLAISLIIIVFLYQKKNIS